MKPKPILTIVMSIILCCHAPAQVQDMDEELADLASKLATLTKHNGKKRVTVLDFTDLQGGSSELGKYIAEELTVRLVMVKKDFSVLDRANRRKILVEHKLTASGLVDPKNAKKLGEFAGVDALILGNIIPKGEKISLTAKIITTDTSEIVAAAKAEFKTDAIVQRLLTQPAISDEATNTGPSGSDQQKENEKPFGDLQVKVESFKLLPTVGQYGFAKLTLIITNMSASKTFGVAIQHDPYETFNLSNDRGEDFKTTEVVGIETGYVDRDGTFGGSLTDIPPRSSIAIVSRSQVQWNEKYGDYRPYRLQAFFLFGVEEQGQHLTVRNHNLIMDIK